MSGDGDTRQVISSATMDGSVSYLRFRTQRAAYDAADSRAPRRSHWRSSCRTRSRCVSGNLDKPGAAQALADQTKSGSKKSPSHMSLTARDTPPRCSNSDLQHVRAE